MPSATASRPGKPIPSAGGSGSSSGPLDPIGWFENFIGGPDGSGPSSTTKQMILGGVSGWVTGFLAMKIGKAAATAIGGGIILLQIANHQGYIKINWSRLQRDMDTMTTKIQEAGTSVEQKKNWTEKLEKKLEKIADKAESVVNRIESRSQSWYDRALGRESRDLRIFLSSFAVGTTIGVITGG